MKRIFTFMEAPKKTGFTSDTEETESSSSESKESPRQLNPSHMYAKTAKTAKTMTKDQKIAALTEELRIIESDICEEENSQAPDAGILKVLNAQKEAVKKELAELTPPQNNEASTSTCV